MMAAEVRREAEAALGVRLTSVRPLGGGCIGEVYRLDLPDGSRLVAKADPSHKAHLEREAYMLRYLRENSDLPVPEVIYSSETLLVMEFVESDGDISGTVEEHAAEMLADLHSLSWKAFGLERDTLIGSLPQPNPPSESWVEFFCEYRLLYLARVAREAGRLPADTYRRLQRFADTLPGRLPEPERPALIHGDVWSGNVLVRDGRVAAFLDPAIYYADPEIELAFITLFNTFGERFFRRYAELRDLREGFFEERRDVYNLYPLLVHTYYFGGSYLGSVENTLTRFGF